LNNFVRAGHRLYPYGNNQVWTPVVEFGSYDNDYWYVQISNEWATDYNPSAVDFSDSGHNGIVYADGSKQTSATAKYVPGNQPDGAFGRGYSFVDGANESLIWTSSHSDVNAFRGTWRFQFGDSSVGIYLYDITGATYGTPGAGGDVDFVATSLFELHATITDPITFRIVKGDDGHLRLYATGPTGAGGIFVTCDVTEFGFTVD
jgi:hypothetical protein